MLLALLVVLDAELYFIATPQHIAVRNRGDVAEDILAAVLGRDESKACRVGNQNRGTKNRHT
jgi:hypothetical protein